MIFLLVGTNITLIIAAAVLLSNVLRYRKRSRFDKELYPNAPIPPISLSRFDDLFKPGQNGYPLPAEVSFISIGEGIAGATSDIEAWILAVLAKHAHTMFEFGTATGRTTYLWARNSEPGARVTTITLHPEQHDQYHRDAADNAEGAASALRESAFSRFFYSGTEVEHKITQLFGDSKMFDETPYLNSCDLIFIDGSHSYSYVKSDSEKAFRMIKPGGIILWHDYRADQTHTEGVCRYLNELHAKRALTRLPHSTLVACVRTGEASGPTA